MKPYYGLVTFNREYKTFEWTFGDYSKSAVQYEKQDMQDHGHKLRDMTIITFDHCPTQGEVDQLISGLNSSSESVLAAQTVR